MQLPDVVESKLEQLPVRPGCYLFRGRVDANSATGATTGATGAVLYVGKAKSLRSRVRSYFQESSSDERAFIPTLRAQIGDLETFVTTTEKEAAILENSLIKEHQPRYNVKLRDNKEFLSIRLDARVQWPRLEVVRKPTDDGARYFGPYHSATSARRSLHLVNKHFQLRTCSDSELASRNRPCLQHQIKRCAAPCVFEVDAGWYGQQVHAVEMFLAGKHDELTREVQARMKRAAEGLEFELAATYRDQLRAIDALRSEQRVVQTGAAIGVSQDVVGVHRAGELVEIVVLYVRGGRVVDRADISLSRAEIESDEVVAAFLADHYAPAIEGGVEPPDEVLLPCSLEAIDGVAELLTDRAGHRVKLLVPQRGPRASLVEMANENATHLFAEKRRSEENVGERLEQLRQRLRLPTIPRRIECCDISHLGGGDTYGAIVAMVDGAPAPKLYKSFKVRTAREGDDYAAMYEVLARRFRRGRDAGEGRDASDATRDSSSDESRDATWDLPDLFVVDGGKGQLAVALAAAHDLGLHALPIVGLAKEKKLGASDDEGVVDRVYLPGQKNPIELREHSASLFFLARLRDEAHRFSNRSRERAGQTRRLRSKLDDVAGLGTAVKKALLTTLGSLAAIARASDAELLAVAGVTKRHVTALRKVMPAPTSEEA